MGKRKKAAKKPTGPKKNAPLPTTFNCLFCNHEGSIIVKLDKKVGTGELSCKVCGQHFQTGINYLSAAVDVYSDWIDACDAVAKDAAGRDGGAQSSYAHGAGGRKGAELGAERDEDLGIDDDDDDGEGEYV